jgi:hypothetical protein
LNSGYTYTANFSYTNGNNTAIWIPAGSTNNRIVATGTGTTFDASALPSIFLKAGGKFKIRFNSSSTGKITWSVAFNDDSKSGRLITNTMDALTTSSTVCPAGITSSSNDLVTAAEAGAVITKDRIYPNPVSTRVVIETTLTQLTVQDVRIVDLLGRELRPAAMRTISAGKYELDLSNLRTGQYYIRLTSQDAVKVFRVMKN